MTSTASNGGLVARFWRWRTAWRERLCAAGLRALQGSPAFRLHRAQRPEDPHYMVSHNAFLVRGLPLCERVQLAQHHYFSEDRRWSNQGLQQVYAGSGIVLWQTQCEQVRYSLALVCSQQVPQEGALAVALKSDGVVLCKMSFNVLPGTGAVDTLLIARNQALPPTHPRMAALEGHMVVQSPKYLCLAALEGVATAMGISTLVGLRHDLQIAYEPAKHSSFHASYDLLWQAFGGRAGHRFGYQIDLPVARQDLSQVPSKRRKRTRLRRALCEAVTLAARQALQPYRR